MLKIGCHLSSSKGFFAMGKTEVGIGANTFQFFTRNPRGSAAKPLDEADIAAYLTFAKENHLQSILAHAPYTLNACAADEGWLMSIPRSAILVKISVDCERAEI